MNRLRSLDSGVTPPAPTYSRRRLIELAAGCGLGMAALAGRLFYLQIVRGVEHRDLADNNRLRVSAVPPPRGILYDRSRIPLVRNLPSFTISALPADLPRRSDVVFRRLAKLVGGAPQDYARAVSRAGTDPFTRVPLKVTSDPRAAHAIEERHLELPGIAVEVEPVREYMDGPITSHLVGHVGRISQEQLKAAGGAAGPYKPTDWIGQSGLEAQLESTLRGSPGEKRAEVDATGREVGVLALDPPTAGSNVVLTIDLALQREVYRILAERIAQFEVASVVVLDPMTGQVLSMVHLPAYNNQLFVRPLSDDDFGRLMNDPARPMLDGAIASAWPPGSCFKIISAIAALHSAVVQPETRVHCGGGIRLPNGQSRPCWSSHGQQDVVSALANSCDTYFYSVVGGESAGRFAGLGADRLAEWARLFGLGAPTGIDLPGEVAGNVPTPEWKKATVKEPWYKGDDWISAIGQGFYTATPIQMAAMIATVANGGTYYRPQIVQSIDDPAGRIVRRVEPEAVRKLPLDGGLMQAVREGVRDGMLIGTSPYGTRYTGTSYDSNLREVAIAGKTSTAEYGTKGPDGKLPTHGWFSFWAPYEAPRIAGTIFVKRGRGSQEAAKIGAQVVKAYFGLV